MRSFQSSFAACHKASMTSKEGRLEGVGLGMHCTLGENVALNLFVNKRLKSVRFLLTTWLRIPLPFLYVMTPPDCAPRIMVMETICHNTLKAASLPSFEVNQE
jgi:hypothetical protein